MEEGRKMNFAPYQPLRRINEGLGLTGWMPAPRPETYELKISDVKVREKLDRITQKHEIDPLNANLIEGTMQDKLRKALEAEAVEELTVFKERLREELLRAIERQKKKKEVQHMINLYELMKLVDNMTKVRIEVKSEEMALTPHKLAVYGERMVKKVFVNCQGELEVELTDDKPMHCR